MKGTIGFVLDNYHTELLDFLFELLQNKYNIIIYINIDTYNNLDILSRKYKFSQKSIYQNFIYDCKHDVCFKYIILSHLSYIVPQLVENNININKIVFLVHVSDEMNMLKRDLSHFNYFIVSNQLEGDCMTPITRNPLILKYDTTNKHDYVHIVKVGWIANVNNNITYYHKVLSLQNVKMTIFSRSITDTLQELMSKYTNLTVKLNYDTLDIYKYIVTNNVKFVLHTPNSIGIWSGSISFALNASLVLLTNNEVISNYNIPKEFCLSYENYSGDDLYNALVEKSSIQPNNTILQTYRDNLFINNFAILEKKIAYNQETFYIQQNDQTILCNGHAHQDFFVLYANKFKRNGYFIEIGSAWPQHTNNTFSLEKYFDWTGIMIEYNPKYLESYKLERPNSIHIIQDATEIDYLDLFTQNNVPTHVDYLQIDLEVDNQSTLKVLELFDKHIFDKYKFATITFEHDFYRGDFYNTRYLSRYILHKRGYVLLFPDVGLGFDTEFSSFEDWWVHPDLIDEAFIKKYYPYHHHPTTCNKLILNLLES